MKARRHSVAWWVAALLLGTTALYTRVGAVSPARPVDASLQFFPVSLGAWSCVPLDSEAAPVRHSSSGDHSWIGRCSRAADSVAPDVQIGYASGATSRSRNLSPRLSHPGISVDDRWSFIPRDRSSSAGPGASPWNRILLQHPSGRKLAVLYWYQIGDSTYRDDYSYRLALLVQRLLRRPAASQLIRMSVALKSEDEGKRFEALEELAGLFGPVARSRFNQS